MNNLPLSDERLAQYRERIQNRLRSTAVLRLAGCFTADEVMELLEEIERLETERRRVLAVAGLWAAERDLEEERAERAEAALARLTDDSMADRLAEVPLWWEKTMDDGYASTGPRSAEDIAADALEIIRKVADDA